MMWKDLDDEAKLHIVKLFDEKLVAQDSVIETNYVRESLVSEDFHGILDDNKQNESREHSLNQYQYQSIVSEEDFMI